jgi:dihydrofolate synthase/folylpolyglutamate synthase
MLDFLSQLPDLSQRIGDVAEAPTFSLKSIKAFLNILGRPQDRLKTVHVAGTNGKGSVIAFCAAVLQEQGYKVGTFTSPHANGFLQGIRINDQIIPNSKADSLLPSFFEALKTIPDITLFEAQTALSLLYFEREQADVALIETGLGGSFDATNVINPMVSVITSIDLEHQVVLGDTLSDIASHKAGIIKADTPLVLAVQPKEAREVIYKRAEELGVSISESGASLQVERSSSDLRGQELALTHGKYSNELFISSLGRFQIENAALAYAVINILEEEGFEINPESYSLGFAAANWSGRFELIDANQRYILDAAHTPDAVAQLSQSLLELFPKENVVAIVGLSSDKNAEKLVRPLANIVDHLVLTRSSHPRAAEPVQLGALAKKLGLNSTGTQDLSKAIEIAESKAQEDQTILVFGSVFLVEEIREILLSQQA